MMRTVEELRKYIIEHHNQRYVPSITDFGELICFHIYYLHRTFRKLAKHFDITLDELAEVIADHIRKL